MVLLTRSLRQYERNRAKITQRISSCQTCFLTPGKVSTATSTTSYVYVRTMWMHSRAFTGQGKQHLSRMQPFVRIHPSSHRHASIPWKQSSYNIFASSVLVLNLPLYGSGNYLSCEARINDTGENHEKAPALATRETNQNTKKSKLEQLWHDARRAVRIFCRAAYLFVTMAPLALLYPMSRWLITNEAAESHGQRVEDGAGLVVMDWWLKLCLWCVERNGAALVKLMQWASSRPDLFGRPFCDRFSKLQDDAKPHSWQHTCQVMRNAYGEDWESHISLDKDHVLGSGCIGQVYKGKVTRDDGTSEEVAVKVMHPNVRTAVDADMEVFRALVQVLQKVPFLDMGEKLRWLNLAGVVEEFGTLLQTQLDFRTEASHLVRFNENFKYDSDIVFPKLVEGYEAQPDVLVETFCNGIPVASFVKENSENKLLMKKLCKIATRTVCEMIFYHNFVHGDLHPGNVFVCPKEHKFILLDVGLVTEYTDEDHELIVDILASFIRKNGRRAGELILSDSNRRLRRTGGDDFALNEEQYIQKMIHLTRLGNEEKYFFQNLGNYINFICDAASTHHVMMNEAFASMALAVKVQEGIALMLDSHARVWDIANPIILRSNLRRRVTRAADRIACEIDRFAWRRERQDVTFSVCTV